MKIANNLQPCKLLIFSLFLLSSPVYAVDNYKEFKRDTWEFEASTQYFNSTANYSSGGENQSLSSGNSYQLLDFTFATRYVPKNRWSMFAWANVGNSESKNSVATRTNSSLNEGAAGIDFLLYDDNFQLIPEIIAIMPFETIDPLSDAVANSEGVVQVRSRLIAQKNFNAFKGYGWLGFTYRSDGRSFLMPWGVGAQFGNGKMKWGAEVFGHQSVSEDSNSTDPAVRTAYINAVNAGSFKFFSENPSIIDTQGYALWALSEKWTLQANGGLTLTGANSAAGFHVGGFIRYTFDMTDGYVQEPERIDDDLSSDTKVQTFRENTADEVDQSLFEARPTKRPRKKKPQVSDEEMQQRELQQQLDNTEFEVELKSNKKKKRP
ncbi:hypothetical protein ACES2L_02065 [Bdellovibrio bacteriovorus]